MKKTALIIGIFFIALGAEAQKGYDYGIFLGTTESHKYTIIPIPDSKGFSYVAGGYYRFSLNPRYAWRAGANLALDPDNSFRPDMIEAFGLFEFNFHPLSIKREKERISSYIDVGLSYIVDLPLYSSLSAVAGASMGKYMLRNIRVPFNVGVRYLVTPRMTVGLEWALRKGTVLNYEKPDEPFKDFLMSNWRSHFGVTIGYMVSNYCRTCPFYENERKKLK